MPIRIFSINLISDKTGLSRSNLFRKLKGLVDMSPMDLVIRIKLNHDYRLEKAKECGIGTTVNPMNQDLTSVFQYFVQKKLWKNA